MDESLIRQAALFFYFSLENEIVAREASTKTLNQIQVSLKKGHKKSQESLLVSYTYKNWEKFQKSKVPKESSVDTKLAFNLARDMDLGAWRQFAKDAEREEFLAVIWSKVLKLTDEVIAEGIGVTSGTVRHRVGRGLRLLGELKMY